jgi:FKBP-type peptidyl-prolyl cis-trans isomerase (trigger factor)
MEKEGITVTPADIETEIDRILEGFGESREQFRSLFADNAMRENVENDLLTKLVTDRIISIAKGEAPELTASEPSADETSAAPAASE